VIFCVIDEWIDEQLTLFRVVVDVWSRAWHAGGDDAGDRAGGGRPKEQLKRKEQRQRIAKLADLARQLVARERDDGPGWTSCSTSASTAPAAPPLVTSSVTGDSDCSLVSSLVTSAYRRCKQQLLSPAPAPAPAWWAGLGRQRRARQGPAAGRRHGGG